MWTLYCYDDGSKPDIWERWFFDDPLVSKAIRARHRVVWNYLKGMNVWADYSLVHDCPVDGVKEVVVKVKKDLQWRIGGVYGPIQREFTVLGFFYHKGTQYLPKAILSEIETRRDTLLAGNYQKRLRREPPRITDRA